MIHEFLQHLAAAPAGIPTIANPLPKTPTTSASLQTILQLIFGLAGGISLVVVVLAGFRMVVSNGDPDAISRSRSTVIYALVGLAVCVTAFGIVTFVLNNI